MNKTSVTFFQSLNKQPPFFSNFYPKYNLKTIRPENIIKICMQFFDEQSSSK